MIADITSGDLFQVETVKAYPDDYYECIVEAKKELREGARPELKNYMDSLEAYDAIFVGYPNWWGTMPMAMFTFLEHFDLAGKRILPFCTNEGSGMGGSERDLKKSAKGRMWSAAFPFTEPKRQTPAARWNPGSERRCRNSGGRDGHA